MKYLILGPYNIIYANNKFLEYKEISSEIPQKHMLEIDVLILVKEEFMNYKYFFKYRIKHIYLLKNIYTLLSYSYIVDFSKFYVLYEPHQSLILPKIPENNTLQIITEINFLEFFNTYHIYKYTYQNIYTQFICLLRRWENIFLFFSILLFIYLLLIL